jgi:hypothetical protein
LIASTSLLTDILINISLHFFQFPNSGQHFEEHFDQEDNFFSSAFEDFFPSSEPKSILGWISFISITLLFTFITIMFFLCSFSVAFCDAFPLTAIFAGVFLTFVVIFSPSLCSCCRSGNGTGKGKGKEVRKPMNHEPKCVRYERKGANKSDSYTVENSTDLPSFEPKMMIKGRISIICLSENISRICASLRSKYTQDPFLFTKYVTHDGLLTHSNGADSSCPRVGKQDGICVIAIFGCGSKWASFSSNSPVSRSNGINGNTDDNIDDNVATLNPNHDNKSMSSEEETKSTVNTNMKINTDSNISDSDSAVREALDTWLDRILGGISSCVRTVDQPIPYILGINEEIK